MGIRPDGDFNKVYKDRWKIAKLGFVEIPERKNDIDIKKERSDWCRERGGGNNRMKRWFRDRWKGIR